MNCGLSLGIGAQRNAPIEALVRASLFGNAEQGAWFDPSDFSTLFQDSAGTTPVTAVGQPVGRILDKSGRGNHATVAATGSRPTLGQDASGRYFLLFDGSDDFLQTGTITPGTDKAQVFAGVRMLSNATTGMVLETSTTLNSNQGTLYLIAPNSDGSQGVTFASKGSAPTFGVGAGAFVGVAPQTRVLTGLADIAAPSVSIRSNGAPIETLTTAQGTGNYLAYPLFIGCRAGTSLPFSGRIYSLILRFGANLSAAQITQAETLVNSRTGAF